MKKILTLLLLILIPTTHTFAAFSYYRSVTIDKTKVSGAVATPSNFPVLINGVYSYLATTGNGGRVQNANGYDVGFYTSSDCATGKMNWETVMYSATTGTVEYWVKASSLSTTTDTVFYMCMGDSSITTDQSSKTSVWDSNYKGVWHMPDGTTLTANDSTSNAADGTLSGPPTATSGQIDGAASLASSQYITKTSGFTSSFGDFTLSAWIRPTGTDVNGNTIFQDSRSGNGLVVFTNTSRQVDLTQRGVANNPFSSLTVANNKTYYLTVTRTGTTAIGYLYNFTDTSSTTQSRSFNTSSAVSGDGGYYIGRLDLGGFNWIGWLDEVRVSSSVRSADWIKTEYNNQSATSTFYTIGSETPTVVIQYFNRMIVWAKTIINSFVIIN